MNELAWGLRNSVALADTRRFIYRLMKRDQNAIRSTVSWLKEWLSPDDRRASTLNEEPYWACCERGEALRWSGRYQEALVKFDQTLALSPDYARAWHERGRALAGLGRYFEAVASYMTALQLDPGNAGIRYDRAVALERLRYQRWSENSGRLAAPE